MLLFLVAGTATARDLDVRLASPKLTETAPGKIVTASFLIANNTDRDVELLDQLALPDGWQLIAPVDPLFSVPAHSETVRLAALLAPTTWPAGRFNLRYAVHARVNPNVSDEAELVVEVQALSKVELLIEEQPTVVVAGESYDVALRAVNRGNSGIALRLDVKNSPEYPVECESRLLTLATASSQIVRLRVKTDENLRKRITHVVNVRAFRTNDTLVAAGTIAVEVLPKVTGDTDPYVRVPTRLRFIGVKDSGHGEGFQTEYSGGGDLDETGERRLNFLLRGPNTQNQHLFGTPDEYALSYYDKPFDAHVGDRSYGLSPLTERYAYGRGVEFNLHPGPTSLGAFYVQSRLQHPDFSEVGTYLRQDFAPGFSLQGNFLHRDGSGHSALTNAPPQDLYSVRSRLLFGDELAVDAEWAIGEGSHRGRGDDFAYRAEAEGNLWHEMGYSLEKIYAGPEFFGYYNSSDTTRGTLTVPVIDKLRGTFAYQNYQNNLERDPTRSPIATRETSYRPGLRYPFPWGTELTFEYQALQRKDVVAPLDYDFNESSFKTGIGQTLGPLGAQAYVERGELTDHLLERAHPVERYSTFVFFRPTPHQTYSLFGSTGHGLLTASRERSRSFGGSGRWLAGTKLDAAVQFARNVTDTDTGRHQDSVLASATYRCPNGNEIALIGRWSKSSPVGHSETAVMLTYTIPFGVPVGKKGNVGVLRGRVFEDQDGVKLPVSRAILTAGDATAVTDRNGEFLFPSLAPGRHLVRVDQKSIGFDRVTARAFPMMVEVRKAQTTILDVGVVAAARITTRVTVFGAVTRNLTADTRPSAQDEFQEVGPLADALTEITDGTVTFRRTTDTHGQVTFDHLRPGSWTMKLSDENLPPHHYFEPAETTIVVRPGEAAETVIRALPRHRPIQFIDSGKLDGIR